MFDWFVSIIGTVIGMAAALVFGVCVLTFLLFVKRLPARWRKWVSTAAAAVVFLTIFRELTLQSLIFISYKSAFATDAALRLREVSLILNLLIIMFGKEFFRRESFISREKLPFDELNEYDMANNKNLMPSFTCIKTFSVILQ